jgi:hypothetical protein
MEATLQRSDHCVLSGATALFCRIDWAVFCVAITEGNQGQTGRSRQNSHRSTLSCRTGSIRHTSHPMSRLPSVSTGNFHRWSENLESGRGKMTNINQHQIRCSCGHNFSVRLYESVNTQLSAKAVEEFLRGELNRPECPNCHERLWILTPVLFNDMERRFMVWVGNGSGTDGRVEQDGNVIYTQDYFAALTALVAFRADPSNATIPFRELTAEKTQSYVQSYLKLYKDYPTAGDLP